MSQLAFQWRAQTSYAPDDFILSPSNAVAAGFIGEWPEGNTPVALLCGDPSSGKTHLAHCWAARMSAVFLDSGLLGACASDMLWRAEVPAVLEDIEHIRDEAALFHLLRHAETTGSPLLLTSARPAKLLPFSLPDLRSRLLSAPAVRLEAPDEALLEIFAAKCFSDRQLRAGEGVAAYIAKRVERSFAAVLAVVNTLEKESLAAGREITVPFASGIWASKHDRG